MCLCDEATEMSAYSRWRTGGTSKVESERSGSSVPSGGVQEKETAGRERLLRDMIPMDATTHAEQTSRCWRDDRHVVVPAAAERTRRRKGDGVNDP